MIALNFETVVTSQSIPAISPPKDSHCVGIFGDFTDYHQTVGLVALGSAQNRWSWNFILKS
jgi:hypothetical protein